MIATRQFNDVQDGNRLRVDLAFVIQSSFYYGPASDFTPAQSETMREPIMPPDLPLVGGRYALTEDVAPHPEKAVRYYRDILKLHDKHGKPLKEGTHYFWFRLVVLDRETEAITFPWYDTYPESRRLMDSLLTSTDGEVFWDCDQCWEMTIYADGDFFYINQQNPYYNEDYGTYRFTKSSLQSQLYAARARTETILAVLQRELGADYFGKDR